MFWIFLSDWWKRNSLDFCFCFSTTADHGNSAQGSDGAEAGRLRYDERQIVLRSRLSDTIPCPFSSSPFHTRIASKPPSSLLCDFMKSCWTKNKRIRAPFLHTVAACRHLDFHLASFSPPVFKIMIKNDGNGHCHTTIYNTNTIPANLASLGQSFHPFSTKFCISSIHEWINYRFIYGMVTKRVWFLDIFDIRWCKTASWKWKRDWISWWMKRWTFFFQWLTRVLKSR